MTREAEMPAGAQGHPLLISWQRHGEKHLELTLPKRQAGRRGVMNLTSSCIVFHAQLKSKPVQQSHELQNKEAAHLCTESNGKKTPALSCLSNSSAESCSFMSGIGGRVNILKKVLLMGTSNFSGYCAKRIDQIC